LAAATKTGSNGDDSDDGEPTVACPKCKAEILEASPRCPYCEQYRSEEDHVGPKKPLWVIATALIRLGVAVWWVIAAL
jgi:hypothetical protein